MISHTGDVSKLTDAVCQIKVRTSDGIFVGGESRAGDGQPQFYLTYAQRFLRDVFPKLPSYSRCVQLLPQCTVPLMVLFDQLKGTCTGISIVDSTALAVCDN